MLVDFFRAGIGRGERCLYIASDRLGASMKRMLPLALGLQLREDANRLVIGRGSFWARGGASNPARPRNLVMRYRKEALDAGFSGLCAAIDMSWLVSTRLTPSQIARRETLFDALFTPGSRMVAICQYDRRQFQPRMVPYIFRSHSRVIERKSFSPAAGFAPSSRSPQLRPLPNQRRKAPQRQGKERAIAHLSQLALGDISIGLLLHRSVSLMAQILGTELAEAVGSLSPHHAVEVLAGRGWSGDCAPQADRIFYRRVLDSTRPVTFRHSREIPPGSPSSRLRANGAVSGLAVPIPGHGSPVGILGAYSRRRRTFLASDKKFLQSVAGVLGLTMERKRVLEELQGQNATLERILDVLETQSDLTSFLDPVVAAVADRLGASGARLWFHNPLHDTVYVHTLYRRGRILPVAGSGYPTAADPAPVASWPAWRKLFALARPGVHADLIHEADANERLLSRPDRARTLLRVPLQLGNRSLGIVAVSLPDDRRFLPQDFERIQSLVHYITLVVRLKQLSGQAREEAVVEERNRLALEIHDSLAQSLTAIALHLQAAEKAAGKLSPVSRRHLRLCRILAREGLAEARRSVWELRPEALGENGVSGALKHLATALFTGTGVRVRVRSRGRARPLDGALEMELLRIAQEAMTNVLKHAAATELRICVSSTEGKVRISIADNGRGFKPRRAPKMMTGIGLQGMRERAARVGALLKIESRPGRGTRVEILSPAKAFAHEKTKKKKPDTRSGRR